MAKIGDMPHPLKPTNQARRGGQGQKWTAKPHGQNLDSQAAIRSNFGRYFSIAVGTSMASLVSTAKIDSTISHCSGDIAATRNPDA